MIALRSKLPKEKLYNRNISEPDYVTAIIFHLSTPRLSLKWMISVPSRQTGTFTASFIFL